MRPNDDGDESDGGESGDESRQIGSTGPLSRLPWS